MMCSVQQTEIILNAYHLAKPDDKWPQKRNTKIKSQSSAISSLSHTARGRVLENFHFLLSRGQKCFKTRENTSCEQLLKTVMPNNKLVSLLYERRHVRFLNVYAKLEKSPRKKNVSCGTGYYHRYFVLRNIELQSPTSKPGVCCVYQKLNVFA